MGETRAEFTMTVAEIEKHLFDSTRWLFLHDCITKRQRDKAEDKIRTRVLKLATERHEVLPFARPEPTGEKR